MLPLPFVEKFILQDLQLIEPCAVRPVHHRVHDKVVVVPLEKLLWRRACLQGEALNRKVQLHAEGADDGVHGSHGAQLLRDAEDHHLVRDEFLLKLASPQLTTQVGAAGARSVGEAVLDPAVLRFDQALDIWDEAPPGKQRPQMGESMQLLALDERQGLPMEDSTCKKACATYGAYELSRDVRYRAI